MTAASLNGLRRKAAYMPLAASATALSGSELMTTAGTLRYAGSSFMALSMAGPSIIGIMKSSRTRSGRLLPRSANPCPPLTAVTTSWPASANTDWRTSATLNSSSTTRISATLILTAMPGGWRPDRALIPFLPDHLRQNLLCRRRIRLDDYAIPGDREPVQCAVDLRVPDLQYRNHPVQPRAQLDVAHHQDDFRYA